MEQDLTEKSGAGSIAKPMKINEIIWKINEIQGSRLHFSSTQHVWYVSRSVWVVVGRCSRALGLSTIDV